jgi:hypothetical protein
MRLVVIDPVSAFLNGTDSHRDADVRQLLTPLAKLAARHSVCVLLVTHMSKSGKGGQRALYRSMGSIGIAGASRAAYLVCQDPNDVERRLMLPTKNNLAANSGGLAFRIDAGPMLAWEGAVSMTADEALTEADAANDPQKTEAKELLERLLSGGAVASDEILSAGREQGLSEKTIRRAKAELKIEADRSGFGRGARWYWRLPGSSDAPEVEQNINDLGF